MNPSSQLSSHSRPQPPPHAHSPPQPPPHSPRTPLPHDRFILLSEVIKSFSPSFFLFSVESVPYPPVPNDLRNTHTGNLNSIHKFEILSTRHLQTRGATGTRQIELRPSRIPYTYPCGGRGAFTRQSTDQNNKNGHGERKAWVRLLGLINGSSLVYIQI